MKAEKKYFNAVCGAIIAILAVGGLTACTNTTITTHGQVVSESQLKTLTRGVDTRDSVRSKLGSPSTTGTFNADRWYYFTATTESKVLQPNELQSRRIVIVEFDKTGAVANLLIKTEEDGRVIPFNPEKTKTQGQSMGVLDQLFDNISPGF